MSIVTRLCISGYRSLRDVRLEIEPLTVVTGAKPETSLHPDLLAPLARLIADAAKRSQIIVVSHAERLVSALTKAGGRRITLAKELGETVAEDEDRPMWNWPSR